MLDASAMEEARPCARVRCPVSKNFASGALPGMRKLLLSQLGTRYGSRTFQDVSSRSSTHVAKTEKMYNCGVVSFDLVMSADGKKWKVAEKAIKEVYLGFKKSSRSKKSSRNMLLVACAVALVTFSPSASSSTSAPITNSNSIFDVCRMDDCRADLLQGGQDTHRHLFLRVRSFIFLVLHWQ